MVVIALIGLSAVSLALTAGTFHRDAASRAAERQEANMRVFWSLLSNYGAEFHAADGKLYAGHQALNGLYGPVDEMNRLVGGNATIFMGDERVATNVKKPDGTRAIGTHLAPGPVYEAVLKSGRPYRGEAEILGRPFFTAYDPIKDPSGAVVGILFVGIPTAEFFAAVDSTLVTIGLTTLGVAGFAVFVCLLVARRMFQPLDALRASADRLKDADTTGTVPCTDRGDDIGRLARALASLREASLEKSRIEAEVAEQRKALALRDDADRRAREAAAAAQHDVVAQLATGLEHLSSGNLAFRLDRPFAAAYEKLRADFNAALATVAATLRTITQTADAIQATTSTISTASTEFSERTQAQAQRLETTVASLTRVVASVGESAKAATATHATVDAARDTAERSAAIVHKAIAAMSEIGDSSQQIQQIIGVIDEIAFQTNLLALNAAVEAARAGDQGRGFAVVASEVRNLASRSSDAAKQVKTLIFRSSEQVEKGTALVGETGRALEGIARQVSGINEMVRDFTATAISQADEVRAVSHALAEVDDLTQRNAAMIEESVIANQALVSEARELTQQIAQFRLAPGDASSGRNTAARRSA